MSYIQSILAASVILAATAGAHALNDSENNSIATVDNSALIYERSFSVPKNISNTYIQPDFSLPPAFGSVSLRTGFTPDPYVVEVLVGGELSARSALSGARIGQAGDRNCRGNIAEAPDFRLQYQAGSSLPLIIRTNADFDTTLVVNGPDGTWYCDDDSGRGVQAALRWDNPQSGQYDIWVGAFSTSRNYEPALLEISELGSRSGSGSWSTDVFGGASGGGSASGLDFSLSPVNGALSLSSGFTPDPRVIDVRARSQVAVSSAMSGVSVERTGDGRCRGHTGQAPDVSVNYEAGSIFPFIVRAVASYDTTLVVNAPDGSWHCDDDSGQGTQAELVFERPRSGRYDIWFGSFLSGRDGQQGRIEISELD